MFERSSRSSARKRRTPLAIVGGCALAAIACSLALQAGQGPPSDATALQIIVASSSEEAEQLRAQVNGGADFGALARDKSIDPTGHDGGHLGKFSVASLRPELRDALQGITPGQTTPVVRIPTGYAILRIVPDSESPASVDGSPSRTLAAAATGATRDALSVAGLVEADLVFQSAPKPDGWNEDLQQICRIRNDSLGAMHLKLEGILGQSGSAADSSRATPMEVFQTKYALAQLYAYAGDMEKAIRWWRDAQKTADAGIPDARAMMTETLAVALLHKSEMDNGVYRTPGDMCLFPPRSSRAVAQPAGAEEALRHMSAYLSDRPEDLEVKWLFNLASMLLGRYPGGVPARFLIHPPVFAASSPAGQIGRFVDVAPAAGLKVFSMAGGAVVDDFRGSGLLDVVTSSMDACEPLHVFRNNGDGTFAERSAQAGVSDQLGGLNLIQADYNNDGCMDLLVLRGGWEFPMRKSLLKNNCDGTFTDVTRQSGAGFTATSTQTAVWADIDNDGFLDLFVGNEDGPNQLYRNKGDGTFEDISSRAGVDTAIFTKAVVAADYDNDGFVDFYLSNFNGNNLLYHNNKNRTFTEVGKQAGVQAPWRSFAAWFFDYDNDGWPDLFVNSYYFSLEETMRSYLGMPHGGETSKLYRNLGNGTFADVTADAALDKVWMPMAANFGDADGDGYLDMYLGMGNPSFATLLPHELLLNRGGKRFVSATAASGTGELHKGHGIAFADLDRDGDEDIVAEIGGAVPADRHALRLFENPGNGNDWINVRLIGVKSNRAAIGARVAVTVESDVDGGHATRVLYRTVGSGGSFGANPMEQHIGLGRSARITGIDVWWPATNTRQHFGNVARNQFVEITEFATEYRRVTRKAVTLGGAARGRQ